MTVSTASHQKAERGKIRYEIKKIVRTELREARIKLKDVRGRSGELRKDGRPFHYNTILTAFDKDHKYWNERLIDLAKRMIDEKKLLTCNKKLKSTKNEKSFNH